MYALMPCDLPLTLDRMHPIEINSNHCLINPFTPTDRFSAIQNNESKSPIKLRSVERAKQLIIHLLCFKTTFFVLLTMLFNYMKVS